MQNFSSIHLPTEIQWEYAARGTEDILYPWGNSLPTDEHANFGNKFYGTSRIGMHESGISWIGCHDMAGNVWEWCQDHCDETDEVDRVIRGGCCFDDAKGICIASRQARRLAYRHAAIGFRIVIEFADGNQES